MKKTLFDKVWDSHVVKSINNGPDVWSFEFRIFILAFFTERPASPSIRWSLMLKVKSEGDEAVMLLNNMLTKLKDKKFKDFEIEIQNELEGHNKLEEY